MSLEGLKSPDKMIDEELVSKLEATLLIDNYVYRTRMLAEHGFAILLKAQVGDDPNHKYTILLDTGQTEQVITHNLYELDLNLRELDAIVLSHGHYDHTGGLKKVETMLTKEVPVICHPDALLPKFTNPEKGEIREIGFPFNVETFQETKISLRESIGSYYIHPAILTTGEVERKTNFETVAPRFQKRSDSGEIIHDLILDDQSLIFIMKSGLVICTGCGHAGIINIIKKARSLTGVTKIHAIIGGFHLIDAKFDRLRQTIDELKKIDIDQLCPVHCTGLFAINSFINEFPNKFKAGGVGARFKFVS